MSFIYQVIGDYETVDTGDNEYLIAGKGDIIVDCEIIDDHWFRGKNIRSGDYGLIPRENIVALEPNEYSELEPELVEKLQEEGLDVSSDSPRHRVNKTQESQEATLDSDDVVSPLNKKSYLSKFGESNYVEMSSEETLNIVDQPPTTEEKMPTERRMTNPLPKPPRLPQDTKGSDEGYNSGSHYSGENTDSNTPLLNESKLTKQDEAGYEVPSVLGIGEEEIEEEAIVDNIVKTKKTKKKKKSLMMLWRGKNTTESKVFEKSSTDEVRENYYDPPADIRDNYFLPQSEHPTVRVVLSFIAALGLAVTLFLIMLLIGKHHPVLCFSTSAVLFIVVFVVPVTLLHRGIFCVIALLVPSIVANRTKIGVIILLIVFFILGPVFGIADKIHISRSCSKYGEEWFRVNKTSNIPVSKINKDCINQFGVVSTFYCPTQHKRFLKNCYVSKTKGFMTESDQILCKKPMDYFCPSTQSIKDKCAILPSNETQQYEYPDQHLNELETTKTFQDVLFYLLPLLVLLILSEAYSYNKVYLTTKNTDNIYITQRLRELDCERKNRGLTDLILPLTRIEFHTYLVRRNFNLTKAERDKVIKWLKLLLIAVFVTVSLVLMEDFVHTVLLDTQTGHCLNFYDEHSSFRYRDVIYSLLGALLFMMIIQSHMLRLRSVICDYAYPEMVETRSKHLYYKILHDRHAFARHVRRNIQLMSEEKRLRLRISFFSKLYMVLPVKLQWLCSKFTVSKCMICDSLSYRKTVECCESSCRAHYCFECHVDAGQTCLTCKPSAPQNSTAARSSFCV